MSDVMQVLTTNKTHYVITVLCVENFYVEVNVCNAVIGPSQSDPVYENIRNAGC